MNKLINSIFLVMLLILPVSATTYLISVNASDDALYSNSSSIGSNYTYFRNMTENATNVYTSIQYLRIVSGIGAGNITDNAARMGFAMNTSIVPLNSTIDNASFCFRVSSKQNYLGNWSVNMTMLNAVNYSNVSNYKSNWARFGNISIGGIDYNSISTSLTGGNCIPVSTLVINKSNWTTIGMRLSPDLNNESEIKYVNVNSTYIRVYTNIASNGSYVSNLTIGYHIDNIPVSNFTSNITYGMQPLTVQFTDLSTETPDVWNWSFGDGTFSTSQNPIKVYSISGNYNVSLNATNTSMGYNIHTKNNYIIVWDTLTIANFTSNSTMGKTPYTVQFIDTSLNVSAWNWSFGDGTFSTSQNPIHTYLRNNTFTVILNATNITSSGYGIKTSTNYIYSYGISHPTMVNASAIPGIMYSSVEPYKNAITYSTASYYDGGLNATADYALTLNFSTIWGSGGGDNETKRDYATYLAVMYQFTKNKTYSNKAVEALLDQDYNFYYPRLTSQSYSMAYDLIWETVGQPGSTLDYTNNSIIRYNLMNAAHIWYLDILPDTAVNFESGSGEYVDLAMTGLALRDWDNMSYPFINTTVDNLIYMGGEGLWVHDPSYGHSYTWSMDGNRGMMSGWNDYNSGANILGDYRYYVDDFINRYMIMWSYIYNENYLDRYPQAKKWAMTYSWSVLNLGKTPSLGTAYHWSMMRESLLYPLLDDVNRSYLKYSIERQRNTTYWVTQNYKVIPRGITTILFYQYPFDYIMAQPPWTSTLWKDGEVNIFRDGWDYKGNTLVFTIANNTNPSNRIAWHEDQLTFDYTSHGDQVMPDSAEIKLAPYFWGGAPGYSGYSGLAHNSLMIGNGYTLKWNITGGNITYAYLAKSSHDYATGTQGAYTKNLIQTLTIESIDGSKENCIFDIPNGSMNSSYLGTFNINTSRIIIYPFKEYFIIVDRMVSPSQYEYINNFRFGSISYTNNISPLIPLNLSWSAKANGTLSLDGVIYDWSTESKLASIEYITGTSINTIIWNSTNLDKENSTLKVYTSPKTPASVIKFVSMPSLGSATSTKGNMEDSPAGQNQHILIPQVLLKQANNRTLYRVTAIISQYSNTTIRNTSEIIIVGNGSAISVNATNGNYTDYIYTGTGNSTFNVYKTDADTVFIRKSTNITDYMATNVTFLMKDNKNIMYTSNTRLDYIVYNKSGYHYMINISGHGSDYIRFNVSGGVLNVKLDGVVYTNYTMEGGNVVKIGLTFSDHNIEFDGSESTDPPVANFTASAINGTSPLTVLFTDTSIGSPFSWDWQANNVTGANSWFPFDTAQNPTRVFGTGNWSIRLNVTNTIGSNMSTQVTFVNVTAYNGTISTWAGNTARVPIDITAFIFICIILIMAFSVISVVYKYILKNE